VPRQHTFKLLADALGLSPEECGVWLRARRRSATRSPSSKPGRTLGRLRAESLLPAQLVPLVGRDREVAEVRSLLEASRLITLTGPGGLGKTRLAIEVAREVASDFPDGVHFVALAAVTDMRLVGSAIAQSLGIRQSGQRRLVDDLVTALGDLRLLLVLDNFEQVVDAAPLLAEALMLCPELRIMVTSR